MSFCSELQTGIHYVVFQAFGDSLCSKDRPISSPQVFHDAHVCPGDVLVLLRCSLAQT